MKSSSKTKTINIIQHIIGSAFMAGLVFVLTFFIQIPYGNGAGYFNLSDAIIIFSTAFFGPIEGLIAGIIGSCLTDIFSGYAIFAPFTIIAKGLESLSLFLLLKLTHKFKALRIGSLFIAPLFMVLIYFLAYIILFNIQYASLSSPFDIIQGEIGGFIAFCLLGALKKAHPKFASNIYYQELLSE